MPMCSACGKQWPPKTWVCPEDGAPLGAGPPPGDRQHQQARAGAAADRGAPTDRGAVPTAVTAVAESGGDLDPGTQLGEYRIERKIGQGGMAAVYSAVHPVIGKKAAIKVINHALSTDEEAIKRFRQEARAVNQIGHLHIVDIFSFGSLPDGRSYFVMELLQGESLADRTERQRLSLAESVEILEQICDALEAAHEVGIVHRDLKPDNVFLVKQRSRKPMVKLLDFGIAKLAAQGGDGGVLSNTRTGMIMGTPGYISPEQARGKSVDHRTDIYALGCMAYEIILGRLPFQFDNAADAIRAHLADAPPLPTSIWPEIPPALDGLLLEMLDKDPARRPSLAQVRQVLEQVCETAAYMAEWGNSEPIRVAARTQTAIAAEPERRAHKASARRRISLILAVGVVAVATAASPHWLPRLRQRGRTTSVVAQTAPAPEPALPAARAPLVPTPPPAVSPPEEPAQAPPPAPTPATGTIVVKVNVSDARIELDGKVEAEAAEGAHITTPSGPHRLLVAAPGRLPVQRTVTVATGGTVDVNLTLRSAPAAIKTVPARQRAKDSTNDGYLLDPFGRKK